MSFHLWLPNISQADLAAGVTRELAEQEADEAGARVLAPECPACGRPVKDSEWESHRRTEHSTKDDFLPMGTADSREVFVAAFGRDELEKKLQAWRDKHPGLSLALAGEGTRAEGRICWQRFRVTKDGRLVR